jgi:5-methylcytosine-specific restriction endonuclease McrA
MSDVLLLNADGQPMTSVPLSVVSWYVALRLVFLDKAKILKEYDEWVVRSQHLEIKVPSIIIMAEQVKWTKGLKYSRANVYMRDNFTCQLQTTRKCKSQAGKCHLNDLTLDHVIPRSLGGKTNWLNVTTSCKTCNSDKGADDTILPRNKPYKPNYYDILAKRKNFPISFKDEEWKYYVDWPEDMIRITAQPDKHGPKN